MPAKTARTKSRPKRKRAAAAGKPKEGLGPQTYVFRLFVSGQTSKSARAIDNMKKICELYFPGQYQLEVVDVYQQPQLACGEQILAVPTLLKKAPGKLKKILGDLGETETFIMKLQ